MRACKRVRARANNPHATLNVCRPTPLDTLCGREPYQVRVDGRPFHLRDHHERDRHHMP